MKTTFTRMTSNAAGLSGQVLVLRTSSVRHSALQIKVGKIALRESPGSLVNASLVRPSSLSTFRPSVRLSVRARTLHLQGRIQRTHSDSLAGSLQAFTRPNVLGIRPMN